MRGACMGIKRSGLHLLAEHELLCGKNILSLSYPDLLITAEEAERITGHAPKTLSEANRWHGLAHSLPETVEFFAALGSTIECVDIVASRNVERIVDLNQPSDLGSHDLVLDCGTTEHCFNIGQALLNAANAVAVGGYIFHTPPLSMTNHGFYCLQPTLFHDFYTQNGWNVDALWLESGNELYEIDPVARIKVPPEASLYVLAQRQRDWPMKLPTQTKYLRNPCLK